MMVESYNMENKKYKDRHKKGYYTCLCGSSFKREVRKVNNDNPKCGPCLKRGISKMAFFPTKKLKEIVNNNGVTDYGTDYEGLLKDAQEVLYRREERDQEKALIQREKEELENIITPF